MDGFRAKVEVRVKIGFRVKAGVRAKAGLVKAGSELRLGLK